MSDIVSRTAMSKYIPEMLINRFSVATDGVTGRPLCGDDAISLIFKLENSKIKSTTEIWRQISPSCALDGDELRPFCTYVMMHRYIESVISAVITVQ